MSPAYAIDPEISDENGYTIDLGIRGDYNNIINFDISLFHLAYNNRIGFIQKLFDDGNVKAYRTNTGDAKIYGLESLVDLNFRKLINLNPSYIFTTFFNFSLIDSKYSNSNEPGVQGKEVEFVPKYNIKTWKRIPDFTSIMEIKRLINKFKSRESIVFNFFSF